MDGLKTEMINKGWVWDANEFRQISGRSDTLPMFMMEYDRTAQNLAELKKLLEEQEEPIV